MSPRPFDKKDASIFWRNNCIAAEKVELVVTIPTFKRPDHLLVTLNSVLGQQTDVTFAIVVMDNHPEGSEGAQAAREILAINNVPAMIILAHRRGNCSAYNAGFQTALSHFRESQFVQIIDDDEIAYPDWLENQIRVMKQSGADFVGAPQHPIFPSDINQNWQYHPVFMPPYQQTGEVPILYSSGNVLIDTGLLRRHGHPWLDERFNFLGGGDSDFYFRCKQQGAKFAWCAEAGVDETTPGRRTELSWLNSRSLRNGSISALIQKRAAARTPGHLARLVNTCLLLAASPYRSLTLFVKKRSVIMALNPMNVALGRLLMEFGFANEQYRAADKN